MNGLNKHSQMDEMLIWVLLAVHYKDKQTNQLILFPTIKSVDLM